MTGIVGVLLNVLIVTGLLIAIALALLVLLAVCGAVIETIRGLRKGRQ